MVTLTAMPHDVLPPSWDETIVPSLRKRLESESRILTKRLSTISINDDVQPSDRSPSSNPSRTVSPSQNHVDGSSNPSGLYPQRPSAIPRPSYTRSGERAAAAMSPPIEQPRKSSSKRQRTQSTPFPFDSTPSSSAVPNGKTANGTPSPSISGSTSPRVQSPPLGRTTPIPSRIPTVSSRMRSGSQSSHYGSVNGGKASLPPNHKMPPLDATPVDPATQFNSLRAKESSSSLSRQRLADERPPFANDPSPTVLEREFTGRPSSDEERPYQHWYRGDVSRNGGVGEYRVGRRMEMLDIANYGHALRGSAGRTRAYEEPPPHSEKTDIVPRKRAESVSSKERASIYIDPQDETVTGRVLDEMPLTDMEAEETEYERDQYRPPYDSPTEFGVHHDSQIPTHDNRPRTTSSSSHSSRLPSLKSQTRIPQAQPRVNTQKQSTAVPPVVTSEPSILAKPHHSERGRAPPNSQTKPSTKKKGQKRSKSAADALRAAPSVHESSEYAGLADAIPDTRAPLPRNGNWDEVILPTVAKRMGIDYEKEDPAAAARRKARESRVAPAPGTFGYDHTKYKPPMSDEEIPMAEFGQQREPAPPVPEARDMSEPGPPDESLQDEPMSRIMRSRRETMPSSPPFSHYTTPMDQFPLPGAAQSTTEGKGRHKERQDVPHIMVTPPTMDGASNKHDDEGAGCCKCVVM